MSGLQWTPIPVDPDNKTDSASAIDSVTSNTAIDAATSSKKSVPKKGRSSGLDDEDSSSSPRADSSKSRKRKPSPASKHAKKAPTKQRAKWYVHGFVTRPATHDDAEEDETEELGSGVYECNTREEADKLKERLVDRGVTAGKLHVIISRATYPDELFDLDGDAEWCLAEEDIEEAYDDFYASGQD